MTTGTISHPAIRSGFFILSRTLLYGGLWFALWTAFDYFRTPEGFRVKVSSGDILFYLFVGWLFALLNWRAGDGKRELPE